MASRYFRNLQNSRPVIVRRARRAPREFRPVNAQWKVAYADFATAMMAFFMLLWLMSTSEKVSLQGLADYFAPSPATISSSSGSGSVLAGAALGPDGAKANGSFNPDLLSAIPHQRAALGYGSREQSDRHASERAAKAAAAYASDMRTALAATPELARLTDQVIVEPSRDGVRIQLVDTAARPMFRTGTAEPYPYAAALLQSVAGKIAALPSRIAVEGHTDDRAAVATSNWQLSADRAVAARRILAAAGVPEDRFAEVTGRAASEPLYPDAPERAENRRITIVLLGEPPAAAPGFGRRAAAALSSQTEITAP
jgi:chemotaxis protein MotB